MKKKRSDKSVDFSKIGKAILEVAVSAADVVKVAVFGRTKRTEATVKKAPKSTKSRTKVKVKPKVKPAAKKTAPARKAAGAAGKKPAKKGTR